MIVLLSFVAHATTFHQMTVGEVSALADKICEGQVESYEYRSGDETGGYPETYATVSTSDCLKGENSGVMTVGWPGGPWTDAGTDWAVLVVGTPSVAVGDTVMVFGRAVPARPGVWALASLQMGIFVENEGTLAGPRDKWPLIILPGGKVRFLPPARLPMSGDRVILTPEEQAPAIRHIEPHKPTKWSDVKGLVQGAL